MALVFFKAGEEEVPISGKRGLCLSFGLGWVEDHLNWQLTWSFVRTYALLSVCMCVSDALRYGLSKVKVWVKYGFVIVSGIPLSIYRHGLVFCYLSVLIFCVSFTSCTVCDLTNQTQRKVTHKIRTRTDVSWCFLSRPKSILISHFFTSKSCHSFHDRKTQNNAKAYEWSSLIFDHISAPSILLYPWALNMSSLRIAIASASTVTLWDTSSSRSSSSSSSSSRGFCSIRLKACQHTPLAIQKPPEMTPISFETWSVPLFHQAFYLPSQWCHPR